jgi:hypothetical protein
MKNKIIFHFGNITPINKYGIDAIIIDNQINNLDETSNTLHIHNKPI